MGGIFIFPFFDLPQLKDSRCSLLADRAERACNKGARHSPPLFLCLPAVVKFPLSGRDNARLPARPASTLSLAPRTQMRGFHFPFSRPSLFYSQFLSLLLTGTIPHYRLSSPRPVLVRSRPRRLHAAQKRTLVQRVTNTRFFRFFFRTKISTFQGETRTRSGIIREKRKGERKRETQ